MARIIAKTPGEQHRQKDLLTKETPSYRQAYSDRTAWRMACLSQLAYIRFDPTFNERHRKLFLDHVDKFLDKPRIDKIKKLIDSAGSDGVEELKTLQGEVDLLKFDLLKTFDNEGTQAILVASDQFLVLAFRGTESDSWKDIKTDARARLIPCETGGRIHDGFSKAFDSVVSDIQKFLKTPECAEKPLFVTGHSLGGALATVAAKKLQHQGGLAACYTFGAPRVGDDRWTDGIKTPIYRIVNAIDLVTMLPPSLWLMDLLFRIISFVSKLPFVPRVGDFLAWLFSKLGKYVGYVHCGDMRYLTSCPTSDYSKVELRHSVGGYRRISEFLSSQAGWGKLLRDHSIEVYRKKLMLIAERRNRHAG